ncbi:MAG: type II secretion system protein [Vampirovibrionales bacterium]|nr:type II secretion system protein [Vampirovibrionales bacterium]
MLRFVVAFLSPRPKNGFTLIELAIVIAVLGILAAVALNSMRNTQATAECVMMKKMTRELAAAYGTFATAEGFTPENFSRFITTDPPPFDGPSGEGPTRTHVILSLFKFGTNAGKTPPIRCAVSEQTITCDGVFRFYPNDVIYQFQNGAITLNNGLPVASTTDGVSDCR